MLRIENPNTALAEHSLLRRANTKKPPFLKPIISILIAVTLINSAYAANPKSIKHVEDIVAGDEIYGYYVVTCTNGKKAEVSSWNNKELWCLGKGAKDKCEKRQLKIAKISCRGA